MDSETRHISNFGIKLLFALRGAVCFGCALLFRRNFKPMILVHDAQCVAYGFVAAVVDAFFDKSVQEVQVPLGQPYCYAFSFISVRHGVHRFAAM